MKDSLIEVDGWRRNGERVALATVVRMRGSAPRRPGARLWTTADGKITGSVSGGCVESDVIERARGVLETGTPVVVTYGIADEQGFRVGLSCGGSIDVLIEPFTETAPWQAVREAQSGQRPTVLAVAVAPERLLGRAVALGDDGVQIGSIDAVVDPGVADCARALMRKGGTRLLTLRCGAEEVTVFVDAFPPQLRLFVLGATHTAIALCRLAKSVGFWVRVIDARSAFATPERFPDVDELVHGWPADVLGDDDLDDYAYVVILTHDPKFDIPALTRTLRSRARYIGIIGSRGTQARRRQRLLEDGFTAAELDRLRAPVGLDIGARTPEEIGVSILAEMLAVRSGRDGHALTHRQAPIHADE